MAAKVKKGDKVFVLAGRDKGQSGEVQRVMPAKNRAIVTGIHMVTRHMRPTQDRPEGGKLRKEASIHLSNLALVDPVEGDKPTRIGFRMGENGKKERYAKRSGAAIPGN